MLKRLFNRKTARQPSRTCKCCGSSAEWFGAVDFSKSCEDHRGKVMPHSGQPVDYFRCTACGFLFTELLADWSTQRVAAEIYNADYVLVDPDFTGARPRGNAELLGLALARESGRLNVLDYGGGEGLLARTLREKGFAAVSYDPFHDDAPPPDRRFDLVTAYEVVEHSPDPHGTFADVRRFTSDDGAFLFTTLVQPADIGVVGLSWWYAAPRNGHVSLHTRASLRLLAERVGWTLESFDDNLHAAWWRRPSWLDGLDRTLAALNACPADTAELEALTSIPDRPGGEAMTRPCRHGTLRFLVADKVVGRSLAQTGEYAEDELTLLGQLLRSADTVVEANANVGAHTVALARLVGPKGRVLAWEPQRRLYDLLRENLSANLLAQASARLAALGAKHETVHVPPVDYSLPGDFGALTLGGQVGDAVGVESIDGLNLTELRLIKLAGGCAASDVLRGAEQTLWRLRPFIYMNVFAPEFAPQLVAQVHSRGYRAWRHIPAPYDLGKPSPSTIDGPGSARAENLLCIPEELAFSVDGLVEVTAALHATSRR